MPPFTGKLGSISDILAGTVGEFALDPPVDSLAGFDAVAQFSHRLMDMQVVRSLTQRGLAALDAYLPWGTLPLPAELTAELPQRLQLALATTSARLELRLVRPHLSGLQWPADPTGGLDTATTAARRRGSALRQRRVATVTWRLELNLLTQRAPDSVLNDPGSGTGVRHPALDVFTDLVAATDPPSGSSGRGWNRFTFAAGQAVTAADAALAVPAGLWQFGVTLDFAETEPVVTSETEALTEFVAGAGAALLTQALARLRASSGVQLTPVIAPAGPLAAGTVRRMALPPFGVRDMLLTDERGNVALALCAQLGNASGGVLRLVPPLLQRQDFAYAASGNVLALAYKARWSIAARGLTFVGETSVDIPVGNDPNDTRPGRAQMRISFSNVLDEAAIKVMPESAGDAVRLLSKQRLQLLNLWDHQGKRITNLGELANPVEEILALPINLFETRGAAPEALQPTFRDFLIKLVVILILPTTQPYPFRPTSLSGFCSAAMNATLVRWTLKSMIDDSRPPLGDVVVAVQA